MDLRKLFGTDGIRGKANVYPMTGEVAFNLGRAITHHFQSKGDKRPLVIVGKDTRLSCYMLEQALGAGVCAQGGGVIFTGPLPSPAVAFIATSMRADAGVMISASHNSYQDNGIKIFDSKGFKLPDAVEAELEKLILAPHSMPLKTDNSLGSAKRLREVFGRYLVHAKMAFPKDYDMEGMRIVLDCANGAGHRVCPMIFQELGAELFVCGNEPNGVNINFKCGALHPQTVQEMVKTYRADLGVCLDGDADRLIAVDELGNTMNGDTLIAIYAKLLLDQGKLKPADTVVGTVMNNLGLELYLKRLGLKFHRTQVGDRYIIEEMRRLRSPLGGEPSGHIIFSNHSTTGDGTLASLKLVEAMQRYDKPLSELNEGLEFFPQVLKTTKVKKKIPLEDLSQVQNTLADVRKEMGEKGRVVLRYSGTEPLVRVMVEGEGQQQIGKACDKLIEALNLNLS